MEELQQGVDKKNKIIETTNAWRKCEVLGSDQRDEEEIARLTFGEREQHSIRAENQENGREESTSKRTLQRKRTEKFEM